jgi:peptidoglycan/LPS O-acetylase OafA/YrhL
MEEAFKILLIAVVYVTGRRRMFYALPITLSCIPAILLYNDEGLQQVHLPSTSF